MTGLVAPAVSGGLPQSAGMPSVDHLICNVNEHHHLVCHLFIMSWLIMIVCNGFADCLLFH